MRVRFARRKHTSLLIYAFVQVRQVFCMLSDQSDLENCMLSLTYDIHMQLSDVLLSVICRQHQHMARILAAWRLQQQVEL